MFDLKYWMLFWISAIALIRFISIIVGYIKFRTAAFIHTYANKITGIALFYFPFISYAFGLTVTVVILVLFGEFFGFRGISDKHVFQKFGQKRGKYIEVIKAKG